MKPTHSGNFPFRYWVFDDYYEPCNSNEIPDSGWIGWEVGYNNSLEGNKRTSRNWPEMNAKIYSAFAQLRHDNTARFFSTIVGEHVMDDPYVHGGGLHYSTNGSFLQCHVDYEVHPTITSHDRRLNLILFMNDKWRSEWGGQLILCDMNGTDQVAIDPLPGRLAVFECGPTSMHGVIEIKDAEGPRLSCAVYYLGAKREVSKRTRALYLPNRSKSGPPSEVAYRQFPPLVGQRSAAKPSA